MRGQSGSFKESSFHSMHLFSSLWFFFLYFFPFLLLDKKKMPRESIWNRKVEVKAKSERVERELEGKLPPFSWFFFVVFLCVLFFFVFEKNKTMTMHRCLFLWCYWNKKSKLSSPFSLYLRRRKGCCGNVSSSFFTMAF